MRERETSRDIEQAAAQWVARMDRAPLSCTEQERLQEWLAGDVRRRGALLRARALWLKAATLRGRGGLHAMGTRTHGRAPASVRVGGRGRIRPRALQWGGAVAASLLLAVMLFVSLPVPQAYATAKGEMRRVPLADGSTITLNTDSRVSVHDERDGTRVRLTKGEVFVEAAGGALRVEVDGRRIDAGAASFVVRRLDGEPAQVMVQGGRVELPGVGTPTLLAANTLTSLAVSGADPAVAPVSSDQLQRELAWREGKIALHGESLGEAARMFARYSDTHIVIADAGLEGKPVTGLFASNNPGGFAGAVAEVFDAELRREPGRIVLASRH